MKTKLIGLGVAAAVAVGSFFAFDVPLSDAIAIATDKAQAKAACARLIDGDASAAAVAAGE